MKKLAIIGMIVAGGVLVTVLAMSVLGGSSPPAATADNGGGQADHALLDASAGERVYCGIGSRGEPSTLHVAASSSSAATLTVRFGDNGTVSFAIPAGGSTSLSEALGGVPLVDDLVRVDLTNGGAWVSIQVPPGARDPFAGDNETDNFCINIPAEQGTNTISVPGYGTTLPAGMDANNDEKLD